MEWKLIPGHDEDTGLEIMFWRLEIPSIQWVLDVDPPYDVDVVLDSPWRACAKPFTDGEDWWDAKWFGYAETAEAAKALAVEWMTNHLRQTLEDLKK